MADVNTQLAVIGGGPGGYAAAFLAADLGMQVTLVEPEKNPGGACLYRGCIPSKALLHVARLIAEARAAEAWGIHFKKPKIDLDQLRSWKQKVVDQLTGGLGRLVKQRKVTHLQATAVFKDARTLTVTDARGDQSTLGFEQAIIASGSRPVTIPAFNPGSEHIWTSRQAWNWPKCPNGSWSSLSLSIHPHPTLSETIKEAAEIYHGTATHVYRPKRKKGKDG